MPRTLKDLIAVRTRVHRGNRQLRNWRAPSGLPHACPAPRRKVVRGLPATAWRRPDLWAGLIAYVAINVVSKMRQGPEVHQLGP